MENGKTGGSSGSWFVGGLAAVAVALIFLLARELVRARHPPAPVYHASPPLSAETSPPLPAVPTFPDNSPSLLPSSSPVPSSSGSSDEAWAQWAQRGYEMTQAGRYTDAANAYEKAVSMKPGDKTLEHNLAYALGGIAHDHLKEKSFERARDRFREAIRHEDRGFLEQGLGISLYELGDEDSAISAFEQAVRLDPKLATSYIYLGQIYYRRNEMAKALQRLEEASRLDPQDERLSAFYQKVKQGYAVQSNFREHGTAHFTLLFEGEKSERIAEEVRGILEEGYREVGRALSTYPERPISVILYSRKQFQEAARGPDWAGGIYDGKIHVPVGGEMDNAVALRGILYHEYTHALVQQTARKQVPTWLNEGLAETFEGRVTGHSHTFRPQGAFPPLSALHGSFLSLDGPAAAAAYAESASAVGYLIDRYGFYRMHNLLEALSTKSFPDAFEDAYLVSYSEFQKEWQAALEKP
jgi:tetratricopeptide (TPR) repeat protein